MKRQLRVFSRHPSHNVLRKTKLLLPSLTLIRLGSTTSGNRGYNCEINSIKGVQNSANKLLMKQCFTKAGVKTAPWFKVDNEMAYEQIPNDVKGGKPDGVGYLFKELPFPIVAKGLMGSRGRLNYLLHDIKEFNEWMKEKNLSNFIFERYMNFAREYRLHVTEEGCFYTCRKMLRTDCPDKERWHRHEDNCVWITENNEAFDKPKSWNAIIADCVKGLKAVGLDVCSFDVKVTSNRDKNGKEVKENDWILLECNSASRFGDITAHKYIEQIPKIYDYKTKK